MGNFGGTFGGMWGQGRSNTQTAQTNIFTPAEQLQYSEWMKTPELAKALAQPYGAASAASAATLRGYANRAATPFNMDAFTNPVSRNFTDVVAPEIRAAAVRSGASMGSSGETDLWERGSRGYANELVDAFTRGRGVEQQGLQLAGMLEGAGATQEQQGILSPLMLILQALQAAPQFKLAGQSGVTTEKQRSGSLGMQLSGKT